MNTPALKPRGRVRHAIPALLLVAGLGLLPAGAATAGGLPSPHELHHDVRDAVSDLFRSLSHVPVSIHLQTRNLDAFFGGNEYYGPHGHSHAVYNFPVWDGDDVHYRPYKYCNGNLYGHHSARPRLWIEWGSLSSGHYCDRCHGYFPARHGHFHNRHRYNYNRHRPRYYHRHDRYCGHHRYDRHRDHHRRDRHYRSDRRHHRRDHDVRRDRDRGRHDRHVRGDRDRGKHDDRRARDGKRGKRDDRGRGGDRDRRGHRGKRGG